MTERDTQENLKPAERTVARPAEEFYGEAGVPEPLDSDESPEAAQDRGTPEEGDEDTHRVAPAPAGAAESADGSATVDEAVAVGDSAAADDFAADDFAAGDSSAQVSSDTSAPEPEPEAVSAPEPAPAPAPEPAATPDPAPASAPAPAAASAPGSTPASGTTTAAATSTAPAAAPQSAPAAGPRAGEAAGRGPQIPQMEPVPKVSPGAETNRAARTTRKARLRLSQVDPWSVMKNAFVFSVAFGVAMIVLVLLLWLVLSISGVFELMNSTIDSLLRSPEDTEVFRFQDFFGLTQALGLTILVSVLNVVILTALATLGAFLYNTSARLVGGLDVTLAEE